MIPLMTTWLDHAVLVDGFIVLWLGTLAAASFSGVLWLVTYGTAALIDWWQGYP